jgi:hypothetical protein
MIKYRFALDSSGRISPAETLTGKVTDDGFTCISCEKPMIARVNGRIQRPHFGHKVQGACNGETYLHRLAKLAFQETYLKCLDRRTPFIISIKTTKVCDKFKGKFSCFSHLGEDEHEYDLTQYYTDLKVEKRDNNFIPDVSLHSKSRSNELIYIEIAVSHSLSETKIASEKRIIEIPVQNEDDIDVIRSARLTSSTARFKGFSPKINSIPDSECLCAKKEVYVFYVFESGKAFLDYELLETIKIKIERLAKKIKYFKIIPDDYANRGEMFVEQVLLAKQCRVPIKNCYLCRYHGDIFYDFSIHGIFCKTYRRKCHSNDATECDRYRPQASGA